MTKPLLVGNWDGVHAWLQWDAGDKESEGGWQVEMRLRRAAKGLDAAVPDWEPWLRTGGLAPLRRAWMPLRTQREGSAIQARVATFGRENWQVAGEAEFLLSDCVFEVASAQRRVHYLAGTRFHGVVDGAAACYQTLEEIEVPAGGTARVPVRANSPSGYHQLDGPGHFELRPALGLTIRNVAASENDLKETGRDYSVLAPLKRDWPLAITFGGRDHFDGSLRPK